ncbi:hypothetical protein PILCRDRAFT_232527 [Piloderma croceum F 1598]|uniref:Uncharacterized protein n=1 Tax=Piloderma croceum (strain F 1598) TaxID=765440 RepID=A0A0C3FWW4_PILCF|nr:hypothetical protein PILCRDRAFT_232527 [Piloderma croceum F 1598]
MLLCKWVLTAASSVSLRTDPGHLSNHGLLSMITGRLLCVASLQRLSLIIHANTGARVCYYLNSCGVSLGNGGTIIQLRARDISSGMPFCAKFSWLICLNSKCLPWTVMNCAGQFASAFAIGVVLQ